MSETISFRVVKEPYGWAVRLGDGMMTPFRSQLLAIEHANGIADALRHRGQCAEVVVETLPGRADGALANHRGRSFRARVENRYL